MFGLFPCPLWVYVLLTLISTHITVVGVSLYLHRCQSHRSVNLHPIVAHFFRFWLWVTTSMVTIEWVAIHRKHHAHTDKEGDPHSPTLYGVDKVLFEGAELYRQEALNPETIEKYGKGTPDDWLERHVYRGRHRQGIFALLILEVILFGAPGLCIWGIQMMWIPFSAAGIINGLGHYLGYRNFESPDTSTNIVPIAILLGGEELHNNHHAYGTSAKFSRKFWEFDIGWFYICIMRIFGLASIPKREQEKSASVNLQDGLTRLLTNRFQLFSNYTKAVMLPTLHDESQEKPQHRKLFTKARSTLSQESNLLTQTCRENLTKMLEQSEAMDKLYQFKEQLKVIWTEGLKQRIDLRQELLSWCQRAQQSNIERLNQFATELKAKLIEPGMATA